MVLQKKNTIEKKAFINIIDKYKNKIDYNFYSPISSTKSAIDIGIELTLI